MVEPALLRYLVRQNGSGDKWMVWDRLLKRPALLETQELDNLAFSAAETR